MTYSSYTAKVTANETLIFQLKTKLVAQGWLVKSSSDGTTYNSTGDQITTDASGAGGLANTNAWFRIQCPTMGGVTRELTIQRNTTANFRIKYSYSAGFTGGSPGATQTPSSTDEKIYIGGGTDASPTFTALFGGTAKYAAISVGDSSEGYSFFSYATDTTNTTTHLFMMDRISTSSVSVGDTDGYCFMYAAANITELLFTTNCFSYYKKGLAGEGFVATGLFNWSSASFTFTTQNLSTNAYNDKINFLPPLYGREVALGAPNGYKGFSHMCLLKSAKINNFAAISVNSPRDRLIVDILALPWDGTVPQY